MKRLHAPNEFFRSSGDAALGDAVSVHDGEVIHRATTDEFRHDPGIAHRLLDIAA